MHPPITVVDGIAKPKLEHLTFYYSTSVRPNTRRQLNGLTVRYCFIQGVNSVYGSALSGMIRSKTMLFNLLSGCHTWAYLVPGNPPTNSIHKGLDRKDVTVVKSVRIRIDGYEGYEYAVN